MSGTSVRKPWSMRHGTIGDCPQQPIHSWVTNVFSTKNLMSDGCVRSWEVCCG